jgi:thiamine-phosphate pyrophosphorylase
MTVLRILDANANRAREALRVIEEAVRFILDDAELSASCKALRHALRDAIADLPATASHRDVSGDVGTGITMPQEMTRTSTLDVVEAAGKRLGEALRVLEEYGKTIDPDLARLFERLRYDGYALEQQVVGVLRAGTARQWDVAVLLSEAVCGGAPWQQVAEAVAAAGPACIQVREKDLDDRALLARAKAVVGMAAPGTTVVINDRPDIALLSGAHGVHVGQGDLECTAVRRLVGEAFIVGVSTSTLAEAQQAKRDGADYVGVGPMFPSVTKPKGFVAGPAVLAEVAEWGRLPHLAISGITPANVRSLTAVGCRGLAVSSAVCAAPDPASVIAQLQTLLAARERASS